MVTPTQARAALAAAEQARDEALRAYHEAVQERAQARQAGDVAATDRWNAECGARNTAARQAESTLLAARNEVDRANGELRRRMNAVASLTGETARVERQLREHQAQVGALAPELARLQTALAEALAEALADEPTEQPSAAPEPAPPIERDPVWPQPARVLGAGRADVQYYTRDGTPCDPFGRPLDVVEAPAAPSED